MVWAYKCVLVACKIGTLLVCLVMCNISTHTYFTSFSAERLRTFEIRVGNNKESFTLNELCLFQNDYIPGALVKCPCTQPLLGSIVSVQLLRFDYFTVCEVEVIAYI